MSDMNSTTIQQIRPERQAPGAALTTESAPHRLAAYEAVAPDPASDTPVPAVSPLLAGDRLVVSVAEAGQLLGVSRAFAYELAARGELPTIRLGRRVMVPKVALLALVGLPVS